MIMFCSPPTYQSSSHRASSHQAFSREALSPTRTWNTASFRVPLIGSLAVIDRHAKRAGGGAVYRRFSAGPCMPVSRAQGAFSMCTPHGCGPFGGTIGTLVFVWACTRRHGTAGSYRKNHTGKGGEEDPANVMISEM